MNKVILMGRLAADPDVRYTQSAKPMAVCRLRLAVDRIVKRDGEPAADFISCIAFSKTAEFIEKYINKGQKIIIEGRWQTGSYINKDGIKVYTNDCVIEHLDFAEGKREVQNSKVARKPQTHDGFYDALDDDDLPF